MIQPPHPTSTFSWAPPCPKNGFPYSLDSLDRAPVLVWHAGPDGKCDWFNATWLAFTGRSHDQELGDGWTKGVHPEDLDVCVRSYLEAFKERRSFELGYRRRHHSGEYRWIIDIGTPLYIEDGGFSGYIGYCFDITDLKRAEHALEESEERWKFALKASADGVWDWNLETNVVYLSNRYHEMFGYQPGEIPPTYEQWVESIHTYDRQRTIDKLNGHLQGKVASYIDEHRIRCKDGTYKWVLDRGKVMTWKADGTPLHVVGTCMDITDIKRLQESLLQSQVQFSQAFMHAPIGMALAGIDGRWLKVNPALCTLLKYSEQELLTLNFQAITHPDDVSKDVPQIIQLLNGETQLYETEKRFLAKDGDVVWVQLNASLVCDAQGRPAYFIKQIQDITERKYAEERLRRSEEQFESFMDNLLGYAWIKDQAGIYQYANKKFMDALVPRMGPGFMLLGKRDAEILSPGNAEICRRNDLKVLRSGRPAERLEEFGFAGKRRVLLVSKFPLKLEPGGQTSVGGLAIDITPRIRAEKALKNSRAKLRASIEARERIAQDLHDHSIQTLYAVGMDLCECKDLLAAPSGKRKSRRILNEAVDRINEVMRELRVHLQTKCMPPGEVHEDVAQAIRQMVRQASQLGGIRIKGTVQRRALSMLDRQQVAHVCAIVREGLSNIVRHARAQHAQVVLTLVPPAISLEIADDGVGGAVRQKRRACMKQGLRNIQARAARMKAEYTLTSLPGGGTRIRILIPSARGYGA